jgi:hypothetical protein
MHSSDHRPLDPKKVDLLEVAVLALDEDSYENDMLSYTTCNTVYILYMHDTSLSVLYEILELPLFNRFISLCRKIMNSLFNVVPIRD